MTFIKSTLGVAVVAALTMGVNQQAAADAHALSSIDVQNLETVISGDAGTGVTSFQFTTTNTAALNSVSDTSAGLSANCNGTLAGSNCGGPGARLNALAANAPAGSVVRVDEAYNVFAVGGNYSNSDSAIQSAQLAGDATTATRQIAQSNVDVTGDANANAEITSSTGFTMEVTIAGTGSIEVDFDANPRLRALLNDALFISGNSQANVTMSVTLTDGNGAQASWSPQGTAANDCSVDAGFGGGAVTCSEDADGEDLNRNLSTSSEPTDFNFSDNGAVFSAFGVTFDNLDSDNYTLAFNVVTSTSVSLRRIPEPGMLALLGLGMVGMGFVRRKA